MSKKSKLFKSTIALGVGLSLVSCQSIDNYRIERVKKADKAFSKIVKNKEIQGKVLTLPDCIRLALKNNLDLKVYQYRKAVDQELRTAAMLGMLPDLTVQETLSHRNNHAASSSVSYESGNQSLEPSYSSERDENQVRVELLFSVIDFGLSYMNAVQSRDKELVTLEQKYRAAQNLIFDVTRAYFNVAAAQYCMDNVETLLKESEVVEKNLEEVKKNKSMPMTKVLELQTAFLSLKKDLKEYRRSYENSCIELRSLMGYYPAEQIRVDDGIFRKGVDITLPDVELLENIALLERPELYQIDIEHHITTFEARKKLISMFPNVRAFIDFTNDSNKYLVHQSWWEIGIRAAYNLLRLPQQIAEYRAVDKQLDQLDQQSLALTIGILAQVRIACANFEEVKDRYLLMKKLCDVYKAKLKEAEKTAKVSGGVSGIDIARMKMEAARAEINKTEALGNYYLSYFRVLNTLGVESLDKAKLEELKNRIKKASEDIKERENKKIAGYSEAINGYKEEMNELNAKKGELEGKISSLENEIKKLEISSKEFVSKKESAIAEVNKEYSDKISELEKELSNNQAKLVELEGKLAKAKEEAKEGIEEEISSVKDIIENISDKISDNRELLADAIEDINDKYSENEALEKIQDNNEAIKECKEELAKVSSKINELDAKMKAEENNLKDSQAIIREAEDTTMYDKFIDKLEIMGHQDKGLYVSSKEINQELSKDNKESN